MIRRGSIVYFHPGPTDEGQQLDPLVSWVAQVVFSNEDGTVNLVYHDHLGKTRNATGVEVLYAGGAHLRDPSRYVEFTPLPRLLLSAEQKERVQVKTVDLEQQVDSVDGREGLAQLRVEMERLAAKMRTLRTLLDNHRHSEDGTAIT